MKKIEEDLAIFTRETCVHTYKRVKNAHLVINVLRLTPQLKSNTIPKIIENVSVLTGPILFLNAHTKNSVHTLTVKNKSKLN